MFIVSSPSGLEEFARNWCDAVMQARELAQTFNSKITIRQLGTDDDTFTVFPVRPD